jgi:hypothetical protein
MSSFTTQLFKIVVLMLSAVDPLFLHRLFTGVLVLSGPGGGKTSCVGRTLALALLRNVRNLSGLVVAAKAEEIRNWISYCKLTGQKYYLFNSENGKFDPIWYTWNQSGRGRKSVESIVELFTTLASLNKREMGNSDGPFWIRGLELLIRGAVILLDLAGEQVTIINLDRVIKSLPKHHEEMEDKERQKTSFTLQLVKRIEDRKDSLTEDQWNDLKVSVEGLLEAWPALDERPRSSLEMTWSGMANRFLYSPNNRIFGSGECSFTPESLMREGTLLLVDHAMLEVGQATGQFINVLMKLVFQRAWLRRDIEEFPDPVLLWQDEFQYFVTDKDNFFAETCRGSRVITVVLTQNILAISEVLGEAQPGSKTKSLLGNFATKIFLQQNETVTNEYAADQIGKRWKFVENFSGGGGGAATFGGSLQLTHIVEPSEFSRLNPPDADNPLAESICFLSGKTFNATRTEQNPEGEPYLRVSFSRND